MSPIRLRRARLGAIAAAFRSSPSPAPAPVEELAIESLEFWPLREPVSRRTYAVLRIRTRSGLAGYGECASISAADIARARAALTGQPATAYELLRQHLADLPHLEAAVNVALLDIAGKFAKAPIYQFLGGPTRNKVRAMTMLSGSSDAALTASLRRARAAGFRAFLAPAPPASAPNQGQAFVHAARRRLDALRRAGADDLVLDGRGSLTPGDAASLCAALERFHLLWLDEPCRVAALGAIRKLAAENVTPLGFGRHIHRASDFQDLLREDAVDVLRPSLALNGISQVRKMAALAEAYYVAVAPHHDGGPIGTAAALQLAACLPNFFIQQVPFPEAEEDRRMRSELAAPSVEAVRDGFAALPAGPGLGIHVNEEALEKYKERAA